MRLRSAGRSAAGSDRTAAAEGTAAGVTPADQPAAGPDGPAPGQPAVPAATAKRRPLYPRLLRLRNVHPNAWQRAALGEGALVVAIVLVLADLASAWTLLVLPLGVAAVVKAHDLLAGVLSAGRTGGPDSGGPPSATTGGTSADDDGAGPAGGPAPSDARD